MTVGGNYLGGVAPGAGDSVIFNTGSRTVTVGPGVSLVDVTCTSGWSGSFSNSGSAVAFTAITGTFKYAGSGDACLLSFSGTCAAFIAQRGNIAISGAGTVTALYVENASVEVSITALTSYFGMVPNSRITIGTSGTAIGTESWSYGTVQVTDRNIATCRIVGKNGRLTTFGSTAITAAVHVQDGATFNVNSSGTVATANVGGPSSVITPSNSQYNTVTVTNMNIYSGGKYVQYANGTTLTITNLAVFGSQTDSSGIGPVS
jgi:hypothetical protein